MIEEYEFGKFKIDNESYEYDIKLIKDKVLVWKGREGHNLQIKDVEDLVKFKPEILLVGTGFYGGLKINEEVREFIKDKGIKLIIGKTKEICNLYNGFLKEGKNVCAIMHGTC